MRREAITLVFAMAIGSVLMAACEAPDLEAAAPAANQQGSPARTAGAA